MKSLLIWLAKFIGDGFLFVAAVGRDDTDHLILTLFGVRVIGQRFYEAIKFAFTSARAKKGLPPKEQNALLSLVIWILKCLADVFISVSLTTFLGWDSFAPVLALRLIVQRIFEGKRELKNISELAETLKDSE